MVSCRIRDFDGEFSEMMGLFDEPGERYPGEVGLGKSNWKNEKREVEIKSVDKDLQSKRREIKSDNCSLRRRDRSSSTYEAAASPTSRDSNIDESRRRTGGATAGSCGYSKRVSKFDMVDVKEKEVREVHESGDDSWREQSFSSKRDSVIDSRKSKSSKSNGRYILEIEDGEDDIDFRINSVQHVNSRERESESESVKVSRSSEVQRVNVKRTSGSVNTRKIERGESYTAAARHSGHMDHQVLSYANLGSTENESGEAGIDYGGVKRASYARSGFQETSAQGRTDRGYLAQSSAELGAEDKIEVARNAVEENESGRKAHRLSEVLKFHGSDVESSSYLKDKRVKQMDTRSNLVKNSDQVTIDTRTQLQLQKFYEENRVKERDKKIDKVDDSFQLIVDKKRQYDKGSIEHKDSGRNIQMLSAISDFDGGNAESNSRYKGKMVSQMEARSNFVESSACMTRDKGILVEINVANVDQIGMSRFSPSEIATNNIWSPDARVDPEECVTIATLNQVSSLSKQQNQANQHGYHQYGVESERDITKIDLSRSNHRRISGIHETSNSSVENRKESSNKTSSVVLIHERNGSQRSPLVGESQQNSTMQIASTGTFDSVSCSPHTQNEGANSMVVDDIHQIRNDAIESSHHSDNSSALYTGEFVDNLQQEIMSMNKSTAASMVSCVVQIGETGRRESYAAKTESQKETSSAGTSSAVVIQDWKDRQRSQLTGEPSKSKTMQMGFPRISGDVSSSLQAPSESDNARMYKDDIHQIGEHAIESTHNLEKSSALHVSEFVDKLQQEMLDLNKSRNSEYQVETSGSGSQETVGKLQVSESELIGSKNHEDDGYVKECGRLSLSGLGMKGPSDEMWDVHELSSQKPSKVEETDKYSSVTKAIHFASTTPTSETAVSRRSHRSLWSYVADIIHMSWILRGHSHSSAPKTDKKASSNESLSSEAWFSGSEPDDDEAEDVSLEKETGSLLMESAPAKGSVEQLSEESTISNNSTVSEPYPFTSEDFQKTRLSAKIASSLVDVQQPEYAELNQGIHSGAVLVEQSVVSTSSAASIMTNIVKPRVGDKATVLKPSSTFPVGMKRRGFSSRISQTVDESQAKDALVREEVAYSGLEISEQPSIPTAEPPLPKVTDIEEGNMPRNDISKLELDPSRENLPEVGGTTEAEIKQRKLQRNKQVLREHFDEWEEAFKRESDQRKFDEFFMREAILEAKKAADLWEVPVGAVLVQNGKIIARGCNMVEELRDSTAHAEMICIREASNLLRTWRLCETTLYVTLEPCPMCAGAILQARIDTVVWGAPNKLLGADGSWVRLFPGGDVGSSSSLDPPGQMVGPVHPFHQKITIRRGILATECGDVMQQFFRLRRKKDKMPESSPPSCLPKSNSPAKLFTKLHNIFCMMFCL